MKKVLAITCLVAGFGSVWASEIGISYTPANDLVLSDKNCQTLMNQHEAICRWKKKNDPSFDAPVITNKLCRKNANGFFSMTVSSCLPEFVKANQNKKNFKDGANCWGTAMSFKELSLRPRFVWSNEMTYWLSSPLCRKLEPGEKKEPGDILNIYGPEYIFQKNETSGRDYRFWEVLFPGRYTPSPVSEGYSGYHNFLHSETYLSDRLTFGKDSPNKDDKFKFNPLENVYGRSREADCQENQELTPHHREFQKAPKDIRASKCGYFSQVYRCEKFSNYFAKQELKPNDLALLEKITELQKIQDKLFPLLLVKGKIIPKTEVDQMLKIADDMADEALIELGLVGSDKNREMLLVQKFFTASGIRKSLELAALTPPTEAL